MVKNNEQDICEHFLQLEERELFFDRLKVNNVRIWHYIRYDIYNILLRNMGIFKNPNQEEVFYDEQNSLVDWIDKNILKSQFNIRKKEVFILNHPRRVKQDNYYRCIYTDTWLKEFKRSYYVFELPYVHNFHFKPSKTKNLRYIDQETYIKVFNKKYCYESAYKKECRGLTNYLVKILEYEFGIEFEYREKKKIYQIIVQKIAVRKALKDYYKYLLVHINPRIIIYVVGMGFDQMILGETGRELGIPTVEIQHGHIGRGHIAYNFKSKVCLNSFPEYLFVTGQYEIDTMRVPIPKENIYITGAPELDIKVNYYKKKLSKGKKEKRIVTFISSGEREIADSAMELYQKLDKERYKVYLKLHPSEYTNWKKKFSNLENSGVCVVDDSVHDVYYYLAISDYLIGVASTVLFEATRFGCNIMVLKKGRYFNAEGLIDTGNAIYINSMNEAAEYIDSNNSSRRRASDYFYCKNGCQLIYRAIDDILDKTSKK